MANSAKSVTGINYGQPGQLVYTPYDGAGSGIGSLHGSRLSSLRPSFSVIGSTAELYPPSKITVPASALKPSHERQVHQRWLFDTHPEALPGLDAIGELLTEELSSAARLASAASTRRVLDIGQITDVTTASHRTSTPAIAMAAGEAGEKLRIARIDQSKWAWENIHSSEAEDGTYNGVQMDLAIIDPDSWQDECLWTNDGLPFIQVKFATHLAANEPTRWLLAQKSTSTSLLNPEYHKVPTGDINVEALDFHMPSKIDPQHELTITHLQTGGRPHCDVAFNPPNQGSAAQVAIMDEEGYWTIWAILGRTRVDNRQEKRAILRKQGSVYDGLLPDIVFNSHYPSQPHGTLFIGRGESSDFLSSFSPETTSRAPYLLVWSSEKFEIVSFEDGTLLQPFSIPGRGSARQNIILDAQRSPISQAQVFILTSQSLLWMEVPKQGMSSKPTLILECPHLPGTRDLRMSLSRVSDDDESVLVFFYTPTGTHLIANWLRLSEDSELAQWHRQVLPMVQTPSQGPGHCKLDMMLFHPSKLSVEDEPPEPSLGEVYWRNGVRFFQGLLLSEDLGLRYCIGTTSTDQRIAISLPTKRLNWSYRHKKQSWRKQNRLISKHIMSAFVLPDGLDSVDVDIRSQHEIEVHRGQRRRTQADPNAGRTVISIRRIVAAVEEQLPIEGVEGPPLLPAASVGILDSMLETGIVEASVPLFTWKDIVTLHNNDSEWVLAADAEVQLQEVKDKVEGEVTMPELRLRHSKDSAEKHITADLIHKELNSLRGCKWTDSTQGQREQPHLSIVKLVSDYVLSLHGFLIQDVPLFGPIESSLDDEEQLPERMPQSQPSRSSQSPGRIRSSSPASMIPTQKLQAQFRRLQLLAPSLKPGLSAVRKPPKVLALWPPERGAEIDGYVSSVAAESDMRFDDVRQKAQRSEARKRAQAEKLKRPAFAGRGLTDDERGERKSARVQSQANAIRSSPQPMVPMSSQRVPMSSQSQGSFGPMVTMSQPIAGAFGDRKKAKKATKKKRSGFR